MDAKEYIKAYNRHVKTYCAHDACTKCERTGKDCGVLSEEMVDFIEQWSKEHPIKTNMNKIVEVFGEMAVSRFAKYPELYEWLKEEYQKPEETEKRFSNE